MVTLKGEHIYLRALEPEDLDFIYTIENDEAIWELSHTQTPYSRFLIQQYLDNAHKDIYEAKQLRLVICANDNTVLGLIDLFDFDFKNKRAGVGILVYNETDRGQNVGSDALELLVDYSFKHLDLHQLYCNISEDNTVSMSLFRKHGFTAVGLKKDWTLLNGTYKNEYLFQRIR